MTLEGVWRRASHVASAVSLQSVTGATGLKGRRCRYLGARLGYATGERYLPASRYQMSAMPGRACRLIRRLCAAGSLRR